MAEGGPAVREPVYFEDLSVGQTFATGSHTMDEAEIKAYASKYDPQPFHLDNEAAKHSFFGRLVASGWHTAAITMRLLVEGGFPIAGGVIGAGGSLKWLKPTYPGDTLSVRGHIVEITPPTEKRPERGFALINAETVNQNGEVVQVMTANLIVPRRP
jgi:acyl dehydratase